MVGCLSPWVPHKAAALSVTGIELAEFAKFFPQVQGGAVPIARELFYLPFVATLVLSCAWVARMGTSPASGSASAARIVRLSVSLAAAALILGVLFPYPLVDALRRALASRSPLALEPYTVRRASLALAGAALALLSPLAGRLSRRSWGSVVLVLALVGVVPPLWQFGLLRPLVVALYTGGSGGSLGLGWGVIACVIGFVLTIVSGVGAVIAPLRVCT